MKKIILAMCLAAALPTWAEELHYNVLEFNESASVTVPNDTMTVTLRVQANGKSRGEVANLVTHRVNAILARTKNNKAFEVSSDNRSTYPEYNDKRAIVGWTDIADIRISSMDLEALSQLVADSQKEAAVENISFSVSPKKYAAAVEEASNQALKSFKQRADNVSKTLGFSNGYKIVKIQLNQAFENNDEGFVWHLKQSPLKSCKLMRECKKFVKQFVQRYKCNEYADNQLTCFSCCRHEWQDFV